MRRTAPVLRWRSHRTGNVVANSPGCARRSKVVRRWIGKEFGWAHEDYRGAVGIAKAALALDHRVLPPHAGIKQPLESLTGESSPICTLEQPSPWLKPGDHPRRAGVSAFGFGGTNSHAVLEQVDGEPSGPLGAEEWPCELFLFRGRDDDELRTRMSAVRSSIESGAKPTMRDLARALAQEFEGTPRGSGLAIAAGDLKELSNSLAKALDSLRSGRFASMREFQFGRPDDVANGRVALLFPGQGAQYPNMGREPALYLAPIREALELADAELQLQYERRLSSFVFPSAAFEIGAENRQRQDLAHTHRAQPAIGALSIGFLELLERLGVNADMTAGHSYGELTALHAAGALGRKALLHASELRGRVMSERCEDGGMLSVQAQHEVVESALADIDGVVIANHNGPRQTVISGDIEALERARAKLAKANVQTTKLPVSGAFHSPLMAAALAPWSAGVDALDFREPRIPVYGNRDETLPFESLRDSGAPQIHFQAQSSLSPKSATCTRMEPACS